jgi:site-specific DNA-cytosine methylase
LKELKPKYFLLENVVMKKEYQAVITEHLGVEPIMINSSLVSAQSRRRLYWTNIPNVGQPVDKGIKLKDIIDNGYVEKDKSWCLLESWNRFPKKVESVIGRYKRSMMPVVFTEETCDFHKGFRALNRNECERLQTVPDNYTNAVKENVAMGLLGNGWTVDVIAHIFKALKGEE